MDVFVIEDSEDDLFAIKRCLRDSEFCFYHSTSLREFRAQWAVKTCDVILCDLNIDDSYGIVTFLAVKELTSGVPIIILSGHEEDDLAIEAIQKGAQDYLNKNRIDKKRLKVTIEFAIERQRSREELTKARERVEQELAFRSNFLAHFSHSIRTPLHGLGSMLDLMNYNPGAFKSSEILDNLYYSYARLRQTVEDLLDFEASFGQGFHLDKGSSTPRQLLQLSLNFLRPLLVGGFRVFGSAPDQDALNIDAQKISKAICRVVLNSVKHSGSCHGTVSCYLENQTLRIHVRDNGKGLPEDWGDSQSPFSRGDFSTVSQGAGLGLYLVHESLSLMGGRLLTEPCKQGAHFIIEIPINEKIVQPKVKAKHRFRARVQDNFIANFLEQELRRYGYIFERALTSESNVIDIDSQEGSTILIDDLIGKEAKGPKLSQFDHSVLIVDDEELNRKLLRKQLEGLGCKCFEAKNGEEAVELGLSKKIDGVFMDCAMPLMDGFQATQALRENGFKKKIIACTANAYDENKQRCLQQGFDLFLAKPLSKKDLLSCLERMK